MLVETTLNLLGFSQLLQNATEHLDVPVVERGVVLPPMDKPDHDEALPVAGPAQAGLSVDLHCQLDPPPSRMGARRGLPIMGVKRFRERELASVGGGCWLELVPDLRPGKSRDCLRHSIEEETVSGSCIRLSESNAS